MEHSINRKNHILMGWGECKKKKKEEEEEERKKKFLVLHYVTAYQNFKVATELNQNYNLIEKVILNKTIMNFEKFLSIKICLRRSKLSTRIMIGTDTWSFMVTLQTID